MVKPFFPHYFDFSCHDVIRYLSCQNIQPYLSLPFSVRKSKQMQAGASRLSQFPHMEARGRMLPSAEERTFLKYPGGAAFPEISVLFSSFSLCTLPQSVISLSRLLAKRGKKSSSLPTKLRSHKRNPLHSIIRWTSERLEGMRNWVILEDLKKN